MLETIGRSAGCPGIQVSVNAKSDQRAQGNTKRPSGSGSQRQAVKRALIPRKHGHYGQPATIIPEPQAPGSRVPQQAQEPQPATAPHLPLDFLADATTPRGTVAVNLYTRASHPDAFHEHWSRWRRYRQAAARKSHYARRTGNLKTLLEC
jgi:hypothetical protein